jgi:hypothetical protein
MIDKTLARLSSAAEAIETANPRKKAELLRLLAELREELERLEVSHGEQAASVAHFADAAAREALRLQPSSKLRRLSIEGLSASVEDFERSHPALAQIVGEICRELAALGI